MRPSDTPEHRARLDRYAALVDQKFLRGLTEAETAEMERLGRETDASYDWFYDPIIARLEEWLAARGEQP